MPDILILTETDLRRAVPLDLAVIDCIDAAFRTLAGGRVQMPPILSMAIPDHNGEVDVKTAYVPGLDGFAIKISPGFFDNPSLGLPSTSGLMVLFSARTGQVMALLLDNGYLTDLRTAAAGAVAARALAREDAARVAVIGAGMQARMQLRALALVRPVTSAVIWARDPAKAQVAVDDLSDLPGVALSVAGDAETAVSGADIVITTTPATAPVVQAGWLRPGQHITAMGSDQHGKGELDPACLSRADLYVPDRLSQTRTLGELQNAIAAGLIDPSRDFAELGAVLTGAAAGRRAATDITIADLTGTGVQDTAIATLAHDRAKAAGMGQPFTT